MNLDEKYINICLELADKSLKKGGNFFGALITHKDKIIIKALDNGKKDITGHAEIEAMKKLLKKYPKIPFSECTLYSSFEPCSMCSFVIRDRGIGRIVFSAPSPFWGGYSRWDILKTTKLHDQFTFCKNSTPPEITPFILNKKTTEKLNLLGWKMHHSKYGNDINSL